MAYNILKTEATQAKRELILLCVSTETEEINHAFLVPRVFLMKYISYSSI